MRPINKYILVTKIEEELKTEGGLILSQDDANNFRYAKGRVEKIGHNIDGSIIKNGDLIYFDKSAGHTMLMNGDPYTIISERDVVVVL